MPTTTVRRAQRSEVRAVADALGRAFHDDPVVTFAWPRSSDRVRRMSAFSGRLMGAGWGRREVYTTDGFEGAAIWAPPGTWKMGARQLALGLVPSILRTRPRRSALAGYLRTDHLHPDEPHWYLEMLGTVPERQGHGVGGELLAPVLARCDEEGIPVWAWSSNERNLAFYHRHRFEVLDKLDFVPGGPPIFPIRREPRRP